MKNILIKDKYPNISLTVENPKDVKEMIGMMTEPEKKKHAKNLKRLKKDLRKQGDQYMEVPKYLKGTLTRKYFEELEEIMGNSMYIYDRELSKAELKSERRRQRKQQEKIALQRRRAAFPTAGPRLPEETGSATSSPPRPAERPSSTPPCP